MTTLAEAAKIFLEDPLNNVSKVIPYISSKFFFVLRTTCERLQIDTYSKPYPGHQELLNIISYQNGLYVVCGANDGYMVDPTYYYEKFMGWKGILIEPLPKAAKACRRNRPNSAVIESALVSSDYPHETIEIYDCNAMSVTNDSAFDVADWLHDGEVAQNITVTKRTVGATTLDNVLKTQPYLQQIDLLVIDVEGSEITVMNGFTLNKYGPKYILIEIHTEEILDKITSLVGDKYHMVKKIGLADYLFVKVDQKI